MLLLFTFSFLKVAAQDTTLHKLKVFVDCSKVRCDHDYIKTEINLVDFLLDQDAADVHILITAQRAGNGGKQYQLIFYGQHSYSNYQDTLRFITSSTATNDEVREQMTKRIMMGLVPLIAHTEYASAVKIEMKGSGDSSLLSVPTKDKWNYWIFNLGADGSLDADQVYKSSRFSSDFSANRTTDKLKVGFRVYGNKRHSLYKYTDSSALILLAA